VKAPEQPRQVVEFVAAIDRLVAAIASVEPTDSFDWYTERCHDALTAARAGAQLARHSSGPMEIPVVRGADSAQPTVGFLQRVQLRRPLPPGSIQQSIARLVSLTRMIASDIDRATEVIAAYWRSHGDELLWLCEGIAACQDSLSITEQASQWSSQAPEPSELQSALEALDAGQRTLAGFGTTPNSSIVVADVLIDLLRCLEHASSLRPYWCYDHGSVVDLRAASTGVVPEPFRSGAGQGDPRLISGLEDVEFAFSALSDACAEAAAALGADGEVEPVAFCMSLLWIIKGAALVEACAVLREVSLAQD
jgi:hypothetical protein